MSFAKQGLQYVVFQFTAEQAVQNLNILAIDTDDMFTAEQAVQKFSK